MSSKDQLNVAWHRILAIQLTAVAMCGGAVMFAVMIGVIADWSMINQPLKLINLIASGTTVVLYGLAFLAPRLFPQIPDVAGVDRNSGDEETASQVVAGIVGLMTTETIVRYALLEGGVFLNVLVLMLEPRWLNVAAAGLGLLLMLICLPLRFRLERQIDSRFDQWKSGAR